MAACGKDRGQTKLSLTTLLESARYRSVLWTVPSPPDFYHTLMAGRHGIVRHLVVLQQHQHPLVQELHLGVIDFVWRDREIPKGRLA